MSQNLDATAINQIHALISAQGVNEIISKIGADAVALPEISAFMIWKNLI